MATSTECQPMTMTRRGLLSAVSAMSVLSLMQWPGSARAAGLDLEAFLALSQKEVGDTDLSADIGEQMLAAFSKIGKHDDLAALADGAKNPDLSNALVAAWYTGVSPDPDDLQVLTYTDALMWQAMDYTKPMAICGGDTGYWAQPPEA